MRVRDDPERNNGGDLRMGQRACGDKLAEVRFRDGQRIHEHGLGRGMDEEQRQRDGVPAGGVWLVRESVFVDGRDG